MAVINVSCITYFLLLKRVSITASIQFNGEIINWNDVTITIFA